MPVAPAARPTRCGFGFSSASRCHYLLVMQSRRAHAAVKGNKVNGATCKTPRQRRGRETPAPSRTFAIEPGLRTLRFRSATRCGPRERRRSGRVDASGTAVVHGTSALHGRIIDLAIGGISLLVEGRVSAPEGGGPVR